MLYLESASDSIFGHTRQSMDVINIPSKLEFSPITNSADSCHCPAEIIDVLSTAQIEHEQFDILQRIESLKLARGKLDEAIKCLENMYSASSASLGY